MDAEPDFWVVLSRQADLSRAFELRDWDARGQYVYERLVAVADESQAGIRRFLDRRGIPYEAFWILNAVHVTADWPVVDRLAARADVAAIVADQVVRMPDNAVARVGWNVDRVEAATSRSQPAAGGQAVIVASIDTGVEYDHGALVSSYRGNLGSGGFDHNYNWFDPALVCGNPSLVPCDNHGHGTRAMETLVGDDGSGDHLGVTAGARWIAAKGCESSMCSFQSLLAAAQWVLAPTDLDGHDPRPDLRPQIVNNPWGAGESSPYLQAATRAWVASGIFPLFSVGGAGAVVVDSGGCDSNADCNDGVSCTADGCDRSMDACDHVPDNSACSDGFFCDGSEVCDATAGCQDGPDPCTADQTCDEGSDACHAADDGAVTLEEAPDAGPSGTQRGTASGACTVDGCNEIPTLASAITPTTNSTPNAQSAVASSVLGSVGARPRGYRGRRCGFDTDGDGAIGEPAECDFCDATLDGSGNIVAGTLDPDGDGANEDIFYGDCETGIDAPDCGDAGAKPCKTLAYAFANRANTTGEEDIFCWSGTCKEANGSAVNEAEFTPDGAAADLTVAPSGNLDIPWKYPAEPAMLIGWDRDHDHCYFPYDDGTDAACGAAEPKPFVLDGTTASGYLTRPFGNATGGLHYIEMAHFAATKYGYHFSDGPLMLGFITVSNGAERAYFHDLDLSGMLEGVPLVGGYRIFSIWPLDTPSFRSTYIAIDNIKCDRCGGFFQRGSFGNDVTKEDGPELIRNVTFNCETCGTANGVACGSANSNHACTFVKAWGTVDQIYVIDNDVDGRPDEWGRNSDFSGDPMSAVAISACVRRPRIINNRFQDFRYHIALEPNSSTSGDCTTRREEDVLIERNDFLQTVSTAYISKNARFINIDPGNGPLSYLRGARVLNNRMVATNTNSGIQMCASLAGGFSTARVCVGGSEADSFCKTCSVDGDCGSGTCVSGKCSSMSLCPGGTCTASTCGTNPDSGAIVYDENTCAVVDTEAASTKNSAVHFIAPDCGHATSVEIKNNLTDYPASGGQLMTVPAGFAAAESIGGNVWPTVTKSNPFTIHGGAQSFATYDAASAAGTDSQGDPKYDQTDSNVIPPSGNAGRDPTDTAATDTGVAVSGAGLACDIYSGSASNPRRPAGAGYDSGAEELQTAVGPTTSTTFGVCGDGIVNGSEECDDGVNNADSKRCTVDCVLNICGDGLLCSDLSCTTGPNGGVEACDGAAGINTCTTCAVSCDLLPNDALCDNGLYCDGNETCDAALGCRAGVAVSCNDGVTCTADGCNESTDACDHVPDDGACSNGLFCDGVESCNATAGCQDGPDPCAAEQTCDEASDTCEGTGGACATNADCNDDESCTVDTCDQGTGSCGHVANDGLCDNGLFCDGSETCGVALGCLAGVAVSCGDGVSCTADACNESTDACDHVPDDGACSDGLFCDGVESCNSTAGCQDGSDPCTAGQTCDEGNDTCTSSGCSTNADCNDGVGCTVDTCDQGTGNCAHASDDGLCDDGLFCDGSETCDVALGCQAGTAVSCGDGVSCTADSCNEGTDSCDHLPNDGLCSNGLFCDGSETCDVALGCQAGTAVSCGDGVSCTVDSCNESTDACDHASDNGACGNGLFCDGVESCNSTAGCQDGPDPCTAGQTCNEASDTCQSAGGSVTFKEVKSGTSAGSASVATAAQLSGVAGDLYLAAVSYRRSAGSVAVSAVSGLGLTWTPVATQCSGRNQTGISVWKAQGTPSGDGLVTAALTAAANAAVIAVSRYSGADPTNPLGTVVSANTLGAGGACAGGTDSASYSMSLPVSSVNGLAWAAATMRAKTHNPGAGFIERIDVRTGTDSNAASAATEDKTVVSAPATLLVDGSFSGAVDWAVVALEVRAGGGVGCSTNADCNDNVSCTIDTCNQSTHVCANATTDALCSNGLFCDGVEICNAATGCQDGPDPCTALQTCNETSDTCQSGGGSVTFVEAKSGTSASSASVATAAQLSGVTGNLYLAAVSYRRSAGNVSVSGVSGLGLTWTPVATQCSGRNQTGISVWKAQGTPIASGVVTATLTAVADAAVIAVSRYSGVSPSNPVGSVVSANTLGAGGACAGGTDSASYAMSLPVSTINGVAWGAVAMRGKTHIPGAGFSERIEILAGSGGSAASVASEDKAVISAPATMSVNGTFSGVADWAAVAVEVR